MGSHKFLLLQARLLLEFFKYCMEGLLECMHSVLWIHFAGVLLQKAEIILKSQYWRQVLSFFNFS